MLSTQSKYFLADIPPEPILSEVGNIKAHFRDQYNCKAPLRSPAHITLHMPFLFKQKKESKMIDTLVQASKNYKSFNIQLEDFGAYPPRVIFVNVNPNLQLMEMQKDLEGVAKRELHLFNANRLDYPYSPHMTVAFRDLKKDFFTAAWKEFEPRHYSQTFEVNAFYLLKHNGKEWEIYKRFDFGK